MERQFSALCGLRHEAQALTRIYCSEPVSEQALNDWFASADFEALPSEVTCMAAVAGARIGFSGVPQTLAPRLRGIIKYVHTLNSGMMAGACMLGAALNKAKIPVLLLEDTALYMSCPNASQRHLWQMRLGVRRQDYSRTLDIAREAGWDVEEFLHTSAVRQGTMRQISITPVEDTSYLWSGAAELRKGNAVFLCPEAAAILIGINQSAFRALTKPNAHTAIVRWVMDMKLLLAQFTEADWHRAAEIAHKEHACSHMCLLLAAYAAVTGITPAQAELFGTERDAFRVLRLLQKFRGCTEKRQKLRRLFLLYRLRRPDCILCSVKLFLQHILNRIGR